MLRTILAATMWIGAIPCLAFAAQATADGEPRVSFAQLAQRLASYENKTGMSFPRSRVALLIHAEKYEQAQAYYRRRLSAQKDDLPVQLAIALLFRADDPGRCHVALVDLLQDHSQYLRLSWELAVVRSKRCHRSPAAVLDCSHMVFTDPLYAWAHYGEARLYVPTGSATYCLRSCRNVLLIEEPCSPLARETGRIMPFVLTPERGPGPLPWALDDYLKSPVSFPKLRATVMEYEAKEHVDSPQLKFALLVHCKADEQARAFYKQHLAAQKHDPPLQLALALLAGRNDPHRSLAMLEKLLEQLPNNPRVLYHLAMLHLREDRAEKARGFFEQVVRADPFYAPAHYQLAALAMRSRRTDEGLKHATDALLVEQPPSALPKDAARLIDRCLKQLDAAADGGNRDGP